LVNSKQRGRTLPTLDIHRKHLRDQRSVPSRELCRQVAAWHVVSSCFLKCWVSSRKRAQPLLLNLPSTVMVGNLLRETCRVEQYRQEGWRTGRQVIMPLTSRATHTCYNGRYTRGLQLAISERIPTKYVVVRIGVSQLGLP